jgi:hypothetical protein
MQESKNKELEDILLDDMLFYNITDGELPKYIVREELTRKAIFLSLCSIWVKGIPINTLVNSESSAGKSYICKRIYDFFPEEMKDYQTKISKEAFAYWHDTKHEPDWSWDGKICYLEDIRKDVLESETFKIMCSEGMRSIVVRNQTAVQINIVGKPCMLTTTAHGYFPTELTNRFNSINLDESREQTRAILDAQAFKAMTGNTNEYDENLQKALLYLKRVKVKIPFAPKITRHFKEDFIRVRRDFERFMALIKASCALNQYQRLSNLNEVTGEPIYLAEEKDYNIVRELFSVFKNQAMSMSYKQKRYYDCCSRMQGLMENGDGFTCKEIAAKYPILSEVHWYDNLDKLAEKNLLSVSLEKKEDGKKASRVYRVAGSQAEYFLPKYDEL